MISIWNNVSGTADKRLLNDVIAALAAYTDKYFDILSSVGILKERNIFRPEYCHSLLNKFSNPDLPKGHRFQVFILEIYKCVMPGEFIEILDLIGQSDFAEEVKFEHNGRVQRQIPKARIPHSKRIQEHYYVLKIYLDDTNPGHRRQYLLDETHQLKLKFRTSENENALMIAANKFAMNSWLLVQQCNRNTLEIRGILTDMRTKSWPAGVDSILSEIVFESKLAVVSAMEGSFDLAKVHRDNAKQLARVYHDPLTKSLVCHDNRYVSQILTRNNIVDTTSELRECELALQFLESETNGNHFCAQMHRSFLLYKAEHHLRIGNDFQIDRTIPISYSDLERAEKVLYVVRKLFQSKQSVERRREMVYNVCMARLHDAQKDLHMAINFLRLAECLSRAGAFFEEEIKNISDYRYRLQRVPSQHTQDTRL